MVINKPLVLLARDPSWIYLANNITTTTNPVIMQVMNNNNNSITVATITIIINSSSTHIQTTRTTNKTGPPSTCNSNRNILWNYLVMNSASNSPRWMWRNNSQIHNSSSSKLIMGVQMVITIMVGWEHSLLQLVLEVKLQAIAAVIPVQWSTLLQW